MKCNNPSCKMMVFAWTRVQNERSDQKKASSLELISNCILCTECLTIVIYSLYLSTFVPSAIQLQWIKSSLSQPVTQQGILNLAWSVLNNQPCVLYDSLHEINKIVPRHAYIQASMFFKAPRVLQFPGSSSSFQHHSFHFQQFCDLRN